MSKKVFLAHGSQNMVMYYVYKFESDMFTIIIYDYDLSVGRWKKT